jgi:hypothetical protein
MLINKKIYYHGQVIRIQKPQKLWWDAGRTSLNYTMFEDCVRGPRISPSSAYPSLMRNGLKLTGKM